MSARIVLFGATGYTGTRTAEALVARGARPVLAGRNEEKLEALAERLGGLDTTRADVTDPHSVRELLQPGDVLVTTVGPFLRLGRAAVEAAITAGAVYLDSTGEPPFIRQLFEHDGPRADRSGATLIPAMGVDFVPGNLAGALALREAGHHARRVDIGYALSGVRGQAFSRGTLVSLVGVLAAPSYSYRHGRLVTEAGGRHLWRFEANDRPHKGLSVGGSEHFALPDLAPSLDTVGVHLDWFGRITEAAHLMSPLSAITSRIPGTQRAAQALAQQIGRRVSTAPSDETVRRSATHAVAEVRDDAGAVVSRVELRGPEAYGLTAALLAWAATTAAASGVQATGTAGPVQAFGLDALIAGAAEAGLERA